MFECSLEEAEVCRIIEFCIYPNIGAYIDSCVREDLNPQDNEPNWYNQLVKPSLWLPKTSLNAICIMIYTCIGLASYLVYSDGDGFSGIAREPLIMYGIQVLMTWMWSPKFFLGQDLQTTFLMCIVLTITGFMTGLKFHEINLLAGYLFIPYIIWLTYAAIINYIFWRLNSNSAKCRLRKLKVNV